MIVVILPATVARAKRTQREHDAREGTSRCKECLAPVPCPSWFVAEATLVAYDRQRRQRPRGSATVRPGRRYWTRPPDRAPR